MSRYSLLAIAFIYSLPFFSQPESAVRKFINTKGFEAASIGICIKDMNGKNIASHNEKTALVPASTMKIVTTAAAVEILGEDYRFKTDVAVDKSDTPKIVIRGCGDPTLGSEYLNDDPEVFLEEWTNKIIESLPSQKAVSIEVDDSYFGYTGVSNKWLQEDMGNYYAAGAYGISIFDNTYRLYFNTTNPNVTPIIIRTAPEMKDIVFDNQITTNTTGKDNGYINGETFSFLRRIVGDIPANRKSFSIKGDIPDPGLYLGQTLANKLLEKQVRTNGITTYRKKQKEQNTINNGNDKVIHTHLSPPLKDIIKVINVRSNNHYAEHVIRAVGKKNKDIDQKSNPLAAGIDLTNNFWEEKGLNTNSLFMYDGCGLAPSNKISAGLLCDILVYMQTKSNNKEAFFESLPQAGKEGTVKNLLKGTRLEGKVFVKSGSIADVQCFSGYYIDGDKKYAFSVMVNNYNSLRRNTVKAIEEFLLSVF